MYVILLLLKQILNVSRLTRISRKFRPQVNFETKNKRSVWTVTTKPFKGAHFATFPPDLIEPCILAGSREGDTILDPFLGSGTVAAVAVRHWRRAIGIELNPEYAAIARRRVAEAMGLGKGSLLASLPTPSLFGEGDE